MSSPPESAAVPGSALPPLVLKPREERRLQAGHLWIFSNEVDVGATPLAGNAYKVDLVKVVVRRALLAAHARKGA